MASRSAWSAVLLVEGETGLAFALAARSAPSAVPAAALDFDLAIVVGFLAEA